MLDNQITTLLPLGELDARLMCSRGVTLLFHHPAGSFSVPSSETFIEGLNVARLVTLVLPSLNPIFCDSCLCALLALSLNRRTCHRSCILKFCLSFPLHLLLPSSSSSVNVNGISYYYKKYLGELVNN